jgi:two-component system sensor histidine kinase CiaH
VATAISRLLDTTRRRLFLGTFGLVALLVIGIGITTALAGLRALDSDVDRVLESAATGVIARLDGELPTHQATSETEETLAASDTFVLYLDAGGALLANPSGVKLPGVPVSEAIDAAGQTGRDLRTVEAGDVPLRVMTLPIVSAASGTTVGYVQVGFVLTLHDRESRSLVAAVLLVMGVGLLGAALVTLLVTRVALRPIERTIEAQHRFVADASHELRTPTAIIRSTAEVLQREGHVGPDGLPLVTDVIAEADRLGGLVNDLLTIASSDAAPLTLERQPLDLSELARDATRRTEALAAERGVRLVVDAPGRVLVSGDRDRLVQLLILLLDNAFDHSPADGTVTVAVRQAGRAAEMSVTDEGPGIPVEERERIFAPFHRLPGPRGTRAGGSGLGLAIGRRLAAAHGGTITAGDAPGGGARFTVRLPGLGRPLP